MKNYDVIIVGSGAGAVIAEDALAHGLSVALVDRGPLGGTCLNLGCIPSKMLLCPADSPPTARSPKNRSLRVMVASELHDLRTAQSEHYLADAIKLL